MERPMPARNTPPRKLERTTETRTTPSRSGAPDAPNTAAIRGGMPPRSPLKHALDQGQAARATTPKAKAAAPAKPTQKAIERWEGESPAPAPEPPTPSPAPPPSDTNGALRALLEAVEQLHAAGGKPDAATAGRVKDALERCRTALGPPQGQGRMPKAAQQAHAAQRADPARSPHFGG